MKFTLTNEAPSYNWPSASPTTRIVGNRRQHTRTEQDPDIPWHLHTRSILERIA